jgi:hypothetical protein
MAVSHHDATLNSGNIEHAISGRNQERPQLPRGARAWSVTPTAPNAESGAVARGPTLAESLAQNA